MYAAFFGFERKPFKPKDPKDFYRNANFDTACADLRDAIREQRGFALLTGETGVGKTCLLRRCMAEASDLRLILLPGAGLDFPGILKSLCVNLQLPAESLNPEQQQQQVLKTLTAPTRHRQIIALLIDDAHHLRTDVLGQLWEFAQTPTLPRQRLQIVLAGLPDIEGKLRQPGLQPLHAGIRTRCRLDRLSDTEIGLYIAHQFKVAGCHHDLLSPAAIERIAHHTRGALRSIALLVDAILMLASLYAEQLITPDLVDEAALNCFLGDRTGAAKTDANKTSTGISAMETPTTPHVVSPDFDPGYSETGVAEDETALDKFDFAFDFDFDLEATAFDEVLAHAAAVPKAAPLSPASPLPPESPHLGQLIQVLKEIIEKSAHRNARDRAALHYFHQRYTRLAQGGTAGQVAECEQRLARLAERQAPALVHLAAVWQPSPGRQGLFCALLLNPGWWQCREIRLRLHGSDLAFANKGQLPPLRLLDGRDAQPVYLNFQTSDASCASTALYLELDLRDHRGEWRAFNSQSGIRLDFSGRTETDPVVAGPAFDQFCPESPAEADAAGSWAAPDLKDPGGLASTLPLELTTDPERTGQLQTSAAPGEGIERGTLLTRALLLAADPAQTPARIELVSRPFMVFGRHGAGMQAGFGDFTLGFVPEYGRISRLHCVICALGDQLALMPASDQGQTFTGHNGQRIERGRWELLGTDDSLEIGNLYRLKLTLAWDRKGESEPPVWDICEPRDKFGHYLLDLIKVLRQRDQQSKNEELRTVLGTRYAQLLRMQDRVAALNGIGNPGALIYARFERDDAAQRQIVHYYVPKWLPIGNSAQTGLRIDARGVAPHHADLLFRDGMYWIQNLAAPGSVQVGCHVLATNETLALEAGDALTVGSAQFTFEAY
ncbi:MAG: AAA family ATPase [Candidatus Competibacteraceae bacterium]